MPLGVVGRQGVPPGHSAMQPGAEAWDWGPQGALTFRGSGLHCKLLGCFVEMSLERVRKGGEDSGQTGQCWRRWPGDRKRRPRGWSRHLKGQGFLHSVF